MGFSENLEYLHNHPPRCLDRFDVSPVELVGAVFDGHGAELNPVFQIRCKCGHDKGVLSGYFWINEEYDKNKEFFLSPIDFICASCGKTEELFDSSKHGNDAEEGLSSPSVNKEGRKDKYKCPGCGSLNMEVFVRFEYPEDVFGEYSEDIRGREQDYFTWFSLHGRCENCQETIDITDIECA